jgi:hypothetical protein
VGAGLRGGCRVLIAPARWPVGEGGGLGEAGQRSHPFFFSLLYHAHVRRGLGYPFCLFLCRDLVGVAIWMMDGLARGHDGALLLLLERLFLAEWKPAGA